MGKILRRTFLIGSAAIVGGGRGAKGACGRDMFGGATGSRRRRGSDGCGVGGRDWPAVAAGATIFLLPVMIFTILLRKNLLRGITFGAVRK